MEEQSSKKPATAALTIDRAAFLLLRVKKAFKKKKQQRKEKNALLVQGALNSGVAVTRPAPLLRSRTLPAIVVPGLNILQAQLESNIANDGTLQASSACGSRRSSGLRLTPRCSLVSGVGISPSGDSRRGSAQRTSPRTSLAPPPDLDITEDGTVVLRVPAPHVVAARAYRMSVSTTSSQATTPSNNPPGSQAPLYKLARLLAQSPSNKTTTSTQQLPPNSEDNGVRRLSWERRDVSNGGGRLPRSSSIDSMVEAVWSDAGSSAANRESPPPSGKAAPALCLASPSMGRRSKGYRGLNGEFIEYCGEK